MAEATTTEDSETCPSHDGEMARRCHHSSEKIQSSQTAADFIRDQELLEADAREAMPYSINTCTYMFGPLRQNVFACLTCNPPPAASGCAWQPAGVCYACSVQCHGEHELVEIFQKRNFTCDCGTTRIPSSSPCTIRVNETTNRKGNVHSDLPSANNKYNQNFKNKFCACECDYDPFKQKGTMFQCLGLGTHEEGGCGEDWYHPGCLVGLGPEWWKKIQPSKPLEVDSQGSQKQDPEAVAKQEHGNIDNGGQQGEVPVDWEEEVPMPSSFPQEDDFESFICFKCVEAHPWIKDYADTSGFLPPVFLEHKEDQGVVPEFAEQTKKRKADCKGDEQLSCTKRIKSSASVEGTNTAHDGLDKLVGKDSNGTSSCKLVHTLPASSQSFSLFLKEDFREHLCRCSKCYPTLVQYPQLLEEEETYEPPLSSEGGSQQQEAGSTHGSGSLLERGESALRNLDRVKAIEGVMAYNHLKDKLKPFFKQFAESGEAIGAEDIKAYFAKLRGDEGAVDDAGKTAHDGGSTDRRREQGGC